MNSLLSSIQKIICHRTTKKVVYMTAALSAITCVILLFTLIPKKDGDLKKKLADLEERSKKLEQRQLSYDSIIHNQQELIANLDYRIDNIKEKTTIIKEYYIKEQEKVDTFTHTQIDSFFKSRYKY
jgi:hypothetical protein